MPPSKPPAKRPASKPPAKRRAPAARPKKNVPAAPATPKIPFSDLVKRVADSCGLAVPRNFPGSNQALENTRTISGFEIGTSAVVNYYPEKNVANKQKLFAGSMGLARQYLESMETGCNLHRDPFTIECDDHGGKVVKDGRKHSSCSFMRRADRPKTEEFTSIWDNPWAHGRLVIKGFNVDVDPHPLENLFGGKRNPAIRYYAVVHDSAGHHEKNFGHHIIETDAETFSEWMNANAIRPNYYDDDKGTVTFSDEIFSDAVYFEDVNDNDDAVMSIYKDYNIGRGALLTWRDKVKDAIDSLKPKSWEMKEAEKNPSADRPELKMREKLADQLEAKFKENKYTEIASDLSTFMSSHVGDAIIQRREFTALPALLERPERIPYRSSRKIDPDSVTASVLPSIKMLERFYTIDGAEAYIKDNEDFEKEIKIEKGKLRRAKSELKKATAAGDDDKIEELNGNIKDINRSIERLGEVPKKIETARASIDKTIEKSLEAGDYSMLSRVEKQKMMEDRPWEIH